jgi:hypothetical protein
MRSVSGLTPSCFMASAAASLFMTSWKASISGISTMSAALLDPSGPNGDAHRPKHFLTLRRAQPMLDIVHFVGDDVGCHRDRSLSSRTACWIPPLRPSANLLLADTEDKPPHLVASACCFRCPGGANAGGEGAAPSAWCRRRGGRRTGCRNARQATAAVSDSLKDVGPRDATILRRVGGSCRLSHITASAVIPPIRSPSSVQLSPPSWL